MISDKYASTLKQFEMYYPKMYERAVDWRSSGPISVAVELSDGTVYDYDPMDNSIRQIINNGFHEDDNVSRRAFGANLQKMIPYSGLNKSEFAEKVGITNAMLSRYIRGNSTPSVLTARKIAIALGCTVEELFDDTIR